MISIVLIILLVVLAALVGSVGSLFLKLGSDQFHIRFSVKAIIKIIKNWKIILGIFLYVFSTVFFIWALKMSELSIVYPMSSLGYIFITILSAIFLKERINSYKVIGISLIILGVVLVNL